MANPQTENGYTKIANEIMEALAGIRISGEARQCLDVIIRKTYGFNKKDDHIALSQFALITHLGKTHILRGLRKLEQMNIIITQKGNANGNKYRFNKDFDTWKPLPKKVTLPKKVMGITQKGNASLPKKGHTKETTTKDNITKDIISEQCSQTVNTLLKEFEEINPAINYGNKTQRRACEELIVKFGYEKIVATLNYYKSIRNQKFSPTITTPYQLQQKLGELITYHNKEANNQIKRTDISNL
jgi:phage replication O-like protein O